MYNRFFNCSIGALLLMAVLIPKKLPAQNTLRLSPTNHHYLMYKNKPIVLITSAEHYGEFVLAPYKLDHFFKEVCY